MKGKSYFMIAAFAVLFVAVSLASGETLQISSTDNGVWTSPLEAGRAYVFIASGTWIASKTQYENYGTLLCDAEWTLPGQDQNVPWVELYDTHQYSDDIHDITINGAYVDWLGSSDGNSWEPHVFSSNHIYRYYFMGTGEAVYLAISDDYRVDNSGSVTVEVVPEPAMLSLLTLGGLAVLRRRR
ncbi:MAG: PEP-CTERM sorting domain-containing protein [Phycisphaerae bacterium]|jgi:hypothetical protein